ncbi:MAG: aromatic acid exporter family protein [Lachnospiraceae bacterium]
MKFLEVNYVKWIKLCLAIPLAMVIAGVCGLSFAPSAGIITLLTVFDTRQETFVVAAKRVAAFCIMTILCKIIFSIAGCNIPAYAVFICLFLYICYRLKLEEAIAMNAVLATHFLSAETVSLAMIGNESLLFVIGTGLGIAANLVMPGNLQKIREKQRATDEKMKNILTRMSDYICKEDRSDYTGGCFAQVEELLKGLEEEAVIRMRNRLNDNDVYFLKYMHMRTRQCESLKDIYGSIVELSGVPRQAYDISAFIREISDSFHEMNNVETLLAKRDELENSYKAAPLPESRSEFENRAALLHILRCLKTFLQEKRDFVTELSEEEKARYWMMETQTKES